ncbi:uncharacterized protein LOC126669185 [Mercurialis annua]|uniref:uncharacterized protein LOC126669185 n=1 Tax=Mercurialis annua TaxID=3986 RepID=UPI00215E7D87|nr:uncharacterized protein LOC126669185 [Mercurialis annua]
MRVEKEGSKNGGGYVGGFFQLFDWTAKSRKKLFSNKSDLPERSKQGKRSDGNLPVTRLNLIDEDEAGAGSSSIRGSSDYSCASSVTDDDGFGPKAPGVVARLMGLNSMPTSNFAEPSSTPFSDTQSLREPSQRRKHFDYYNDPQIMYSGNLLKKEDGPRNFEEEKPQKVLGRPIEKFQTEMLPPRSAKSIPITHHKLLSPIKNPGFIPSKTAAHIMEAASRIIEPSQQSAAKAKLSIAGTSSVPLKVRDLREKLEGEQKVPVFGSASASLKSRDLREKMEAHNKTSRLVEASRRPVDSNTAKYLKGQPLNKSWNGAVDTTSFRSSPDTEEASSSSKNKGKSISLAIQAKVNVQRRESLNSSSLAGQKDQNEVMSSQTFRSQPNIQKNLPKKSLHNNTGGVLRQNNQKQNCLLDKDKSSKSAVSSNTPVRKALSGNPPVRHKTSVKTISPKTGTRKFGSDGTDNEKDLSSYSKHTPRKKRSIDGTLHPEKNQVVDDMLIDNNRKDIQSSSANDRHFSWAEETKKKGMDVVSFTFTAPLARSAPGHETFGQPAQKNSSACINSRGKRLLLDTDSMKLSSVGYNVIGGDALSNLLEQKLRELTNSVESSSRNSVKFRSVLGSASSSQDSAPALNLGGTTQRLHDNKGQNMLLGDKSARNYGFDAFSTNPTALRFNNLFQGVDEMEECSSKSDDSRRLLDCRRPSPVSVLEPSFSAESSSSVESIDCSSTEGSKQCSSIQAQEIFGFCSSKQLHYVDADTDLSDSASSTSYGTATKQKYTISAADLVKSRNWEIDYVQKILFNLEYMFQDFALGQCSEIINPNLFNQLESRKDGLLSENVEARLERKAIFDCVSECLDIRCRRYVGGGYGTWTKGVMIARSKKWLAEEVLKEVSAWRSMGDCMVDELVDKDMSSQYGRWLDFGADAFVVGGEIEGQIYNTLLDEVVSDIFWR